MKDTTNSPTVIGPGYRRDPPAPMVGPGSVPTLPSKTVRPTALNRPVVAPIVPKNDLEVSSASSVDSLLGSISDSLPTKDCLGMNCACAECDASTATKKETGIVAGYSLDITPRDLYAPGIRLQSPSSEAIRLLRQTGLLQTTRDIAAREQPGSSAVCWSAKVLGALADQVVQQYVWSPKLRAWVYSPRTEQPRVVSSSSRPADFALLRVALRTQILRTLMGNAHLSTTNTDQE